MHFYFMRLVVCIAPVLLGACQQATDEKSLPRSAESADAFVERTNRELTELDREVGAAGYTFATYINPDTEFLFAKANERYLEYFSTAVERAKIYEDSQLTPPTDSATCGLSAGSKSTHWSSPIPVFLI